MREKFDFVGKFSVDEKGNLPGDLTELITAAIFHNKDRGWRVRRPDNLYVELYGKNELSKIGIKLLKAITAHNTEEHGKHEDPNKSYVVMIAGMFLVYGRDVQFNVNGFNFDFYCDDWLRREITERNIRKGWQSSDNKHYKIPTISIPKTTPFGQPAAFETNPTQLMLAVKQSKNLQEVKELLDNGANPNVYDQRGRTALVYAVIEDNEEIVKALLRCAANPLIECELKSGGHTTALGLAIDRNATCKETLQKYAHRHEPFSPIKSPKLQMCSISKRRIVTQFLIIFAKIDGRVVSIFSIGVVMAVSLVRSLFTMITVMKAKLITREIMNGMIANN